MTTLPLSFGEIRRAAEAYHACLDEGYPRGGQGRGNAGGLTALGAAASQLDLYDSKILARRLDIAVALGVEVRAWRAVDPSWAGKQVLRYRTYDQEFQEAESRLTRPGAARPASTRSSKRRETSTPDVAVKPAGREPLTDPKELVAKIVPLLRRGAMSVEEISAKLQIDPVAANVAIYFAQQQGALITDRGGKFHLDDAPAMGSQAKHKFELVTDSNGYIRFAGTADQHLCSKYERLDCLNDFYDHVARREISLVLNGGNWIDGEASFNKHDLLVHGMDPQMQYLAHNYPKRAGVTTWAITGEDHEGWWGRREGVDVGTYAENVMRQNGREDWHNVGFMETFIPLVHGDTGKSSQLCLMHAGGGSAYAISYAPQKIIEGFDGGDKPAVLLIGHYHKASYQMTRNVHAVQLGCFEDQTIFMRQRKLSAHLGGWFFELHVDPLSGAVDEFTCTFRNYYVKSFYSNRWSQHGPVQSAQRL
jgi:hypothetical protein